MASPLSRTYWYLETGDGTTVHSHVAHRCVATEPRGSGRLALLRCGHHLEAGRPGEALVRSSVARDRAFRAADGLVLGVEAARRLPEQDQDDRVGDRHVLVSDAVCPGVTGGTIAVAVPHPVPFDDVDLCEVAGGRGAGVGLGGVARVRGAAELGVGAGGGEGGGQEEDEGAGKAHG